MSKNSAAGLRELLADLEVPGSAGAHLSGDEAAHYVTDRTTDLERKRAEAHLLSCEPCLKIVEELVAVGGAWDEAIALAGGGAGGNAPSDSVEPETWEDFAAESRVGEHRLPAFIRDSVEVQPFARGDGQLRVELKVQNPLMYGKPFVVRVRRAEFTGIWEDLNEQEKGKEFVEASVTLGNIPADQLDDLQVDLL
jgi:hypothetical protein